MSLKSHTSLRVPWACQASVLDFPLLAGPGGRGRGAPGILNPPASSFLVNSFLCLALPAPRRGRGEEKEPREGNPILLQGPEGPGSLSHHPSQDAPPPLSK
ncbi:unnamed protein product [Pipistrellus nathusii]|uniref:Uncharacterized protein n=1 Tax=Pipistrellus nathusii TaxID=59473 RepID=A0ABN9ZMH3_PIPNA